MQFAPVPAGTLPAAALAMRGGDPDVEFPTGSPFDVMLGTALNAYNAVATANHKAVPYSAVAGVIVTYMYSDDAAALARALTGDVPGVAELDAAFTYITQNWNAAAMTQEEFRESAERWRAARGGRWRQGPAR